MSATGIKVIHWIDFVKFGAIGGLVAMKAEWCTRWFAGIGLGVTGFILWGIARGELGSNFSHRAEPRGLVTHGIYSKVRHPIYIFGWVGLFGFLVAWGNLWVMGLFILLIPLQVRRARREDRALVARFGDCWREYRRGTWF
jgi:protein-S-isoprenylcysteine O-methyltransferase Ste14